MDKKIFIPGKITTYVFCIILLAVLIQGMIISPFKLFGTIATTGEITFKIGYPQTFFELNSSNSEANPFIWSAMLIDIIIYFLIAYILQIIFNFLVYLLNNKKTSSEQIDKVELIRKAKEAYDYYRSQGMSEENIFKLFQEKGWSEEDFVIYLKEIPN